jgi:hypothetical protein
VHLDYHLSKSRDGEGSPLGAVILQSTGADFTTEWDWISLLEFAAAVTDIVEELAGSGDGQSIFQFPDSDARLFFEAHGNELRITCSYAPGQISVAWSSFLSALQAFAARLRRELLGRFRTETARRSWGL